MYRIRTICQTCQEPFGVEFTETGPLEGETYEKARELCEELGSLRSEMIYNGVNIPDTITCPNPECKSVFPRRRRDYSVYDASITQGPKPDTTVIPTGPTKAKPSFRQKAGKKHK